jgi:hypothetical protein
MINNIFKSNNIDFVRIIKDNFIFIKDNKIIFIDTILKSKLIEKKEINTKRNINFGAFDIECYENLDNKFIPYAFK